jgi:penicillin-insensitive murein endopeptidase
LPVERQLGATTRAQRSNQPSERHVLQQISILPRIDAVEDVPISDLTGILSAALSGPERCIAELAAGSSDCLASLSFGEPNRGSLLNAVQMPEDERWETIAPERAWATQETVEFLRHAIESVHQQYPDTPKVLIGDLSQKYGGFLRRHRSHQSGRDADIGYIYKDGAKWYTRVTVDNLDRERTWSFVKALISETDVEYIFMARYVQDLLREYAEQVENDAAWLDEVFQSVGRRNTLIRNTWGHATHMHVRFYNNLATNVGSLTYEHARALSAASTRTRRSKGRRAMK